MYMRVVWSSVAFLLVASVVMSYADDVQDMLDQKILTQHYNGVLVDYLVEEGKDDLPAEQQQAAVEQLVAALKSKTTVTKDEQFTQGIGAAVGLIMEQLNNDVVSGAGNDVEGYYSGEYKSWVDAAYKLMDAGYKEDAADFFEYGIQFIPYPSLQARCVKGLALSRPDNAYDILMEGVAKPDENIKNISLRMLGYLAADENLSEEQRANIMETLIEHTHGMKMNTTFQAAIAGLTTSDNPQAVEAISRFKSGMTVDKYVKRDALRSLLMHFHDESTKEVLNNMIKGGMFTMSDKTDQLFAGNLLIEAGDPAGFKWAERELTPKKKSFFAPKDDGPDIRPAIVEALGEYGGEKGKDVLLKVIKKYKDDEWLKTWMAVALLQLGDKSYAGLVLQSLQNSEWDFTAIQITEALAKHGDLSGLPVMQQLIVERPPQKSTGMKLLGALANQPDDTKSKAAHLQRVRVRVADGLSRVNKAECVPLLMQLLDDEDQYVRSSAVYALCEIDDPAALEGLKKAIGVNYGQINGISRNPALHAFIVRMAVARDPANPNTEAIVEQAKNSPYPPVRFLALVAEE